MSAFQLLPGQFQHVSFCSVSFSFCPFEFQLFSISAFQLLLGQFQLFSFCPFEFQLLPE